MFTNTPKSGIKHTIVPPAIRQALATLLLALCFPASNAATLLLDQDSREIGFSDHLEMLETPTQGWSLEEVLADQGNWSVVGSDSINMGIGQHDHWFRFSARNTSSSPLELLLEIPYASLDYIAIHVLENGQLVDKHVMGDHFPFHERPLEHHFFITPLRWPAETQRDIYLNVRTGGAMQLPIAMWSSSAFIKHDQARQLAAGLYFGTMLVILLYNLFLFVGIGDRSYIYYVAFVLSLPLFVSSLQGYSFQYFWPEAVHWNERSIGFFLTSTVFFGLMFTIEFLGLRKPGTPALLRKGLPVVAALTLLMILTVFFSPYTIMLITVIAGAVTACGAALAVGVYGFWSSDRAYRYYLFAWAALLLGGMVLAASKFSLLPQNLFTDNAVQYGSMLLVILLSFAMAARINDERHRVNLAQLASLEHERDARKAREAALQTERDAKKQLEIKVDERTRELQKANAILHDLSSRDALTGLHNRRYFDEQLLKEYVRCYRYQQPIALILVDIDHFKDFNDAHGHLVGDDCLRSVAGLLQESVTRSGDVLARFGGEEFCILLPDTNMAGAMAVAERVREKIAGSSFMVAGERVPLTISLGVCALVPEATDLAEQLIEWADQALYESKRNGRNRVTCSRFASQNEGSGCAAEQDQGD